MSFGACNTFGNFRGGEDLGNDACPQIKQMNRNIRWLQISSSVTVDEQLLTRNQNYIKIIKCCSSLHPTSTHPPTFVLPFQQIKMA